MTHIAGLSLGTIKEVRAMMPTWLACMAALGIAGGLGDSTRYRFGLLAYVLGAVMLGAQSMGHEYTHRTLSLLLSQPIDRRRLFLIKHGVLASMLLALGAFAWSLLFNNAAFLPPSLGYAPPHLLLVALGSLCVAPYLTMWCRSPLAGVVFTIPLPG